MKYGPTHARSRQVSAGIVKGVHFLMKKNKITEIDGWGTLTGAQSIDVKDADGGSTSYTFDNLIIATGATVRMLPGMQVSQNVVTYEEQILDENLPRSIIIGGSGAIGVEFAYVMKNFGVDVTIVEFLDRMVPTEDEAVSKELLKHYKKLGVKVLLVDQGRERRGHRLRRPRHRQPGGRRRQPGAGGRQDAGGVRVRAAAGGLRPRGDRASRPPTAARSRSTSTAAPTCRTSTPSATSPAS